MSTLLEQIQAGAAWAGKTSVQSCVLILLILLAQAILRDRLSARWRFALWSLLLLRLALPWTPESAISAYNLFPKAATPDVSAAAEWQRSGAAASAPDGAVAPAGEVQAREAATPVSRVPAWRSLEYGKWLAGIWLAGAVVVLLSAALQSFSMARIVRRRRFVTDQDTLNLLEDCKEASGIHAYVAIAETDRVTSPALFGILRPRLLLPSGTLSALNREQLRHVFLHELAHLKRGDIAVNWLMTVLQAIHWFNPLVWYAFARMRADRELACDALALTHALPGESSEYGRTFIYLLEKYAEPRRVPALAGVLENHEHMKRRIAMIAKFNPASTPRPIIAVALFLILGAVCLTSARSEVSSDKAEMMGRVDDFFMHNFRDVTARKSLEWGDMETSGTEKSIRYMYEARIWDRETKIMNQVFTFGPEGKFVRYKNVEGFPKAKEVANPATKEGIQKLVEEFFDNNYRDITKRETIEWGELEKTSEGNYSIRYKANVSIWDKENKVLEQVFVFTPEGKYVDTRAALKQAINALPEMGKSIKAAIAPAGDATQAARASTDRPAWLPATSTIASNGHIVDKTDLPFENDPAVLGHWTSVDLVANPANFDPERKQWASDLLLKELDFLPEGQTSVAPWTWTKGTVLHSGDRTASAYSIREIDGTKYLFLEWKSGDYTIRHQKPSYYVLKKTSDTAAAGIPAATELANP